MPKNKLNFHFGIPLIIIAVVALSRLIPHPWNFSPLGGMALFGAAYFAKKHWAIVVPLVAFWLSSLVLDNTVYAHYHEGFVLITEPFVYLSIALIVGLGWLLLKKVKPSNLLVASLSASTVFFVVSNFGSWLTLAIYPKTLSGLVACYAAGLPFFGGTIMGDLFYVTVLFGSYELIKRKYYKASPELA